METNSRVTQRSSGKYLIGIKEESYKYSFNRGTAFSKADMDELCDVKEIKLTAPKRGFAAFQAVVMADVPFVTCVNGDARFDKSGPMDVIRVETTLEDWEYSPVEMNLVGLIQDDDGVLKADLLLQQASVNTDANQARLVWIEVKVPETAKAGVYRGDVKFCRHRMFESEELLGHLDFSLQVENVTLPAPGNYRFYLDLWQHNSNIARKYDVELWSDEHFAIIENYVKSLADLGQKAITVIASEISWSGQASHRDRRDEMADLFEYSMIRVEKDQDGSFRYDYSAMDRYINLCMGHGIRGEIEVFGLINIWQFEDGEYTSPSDFGDGIRIRYYDHKTQSYRFMSHSNDVEDYIKNLEEHFKEKSWIDLVRVVADEPADLDLYQKRLDKLRKIAPDFSYKMALNHMEMIEKGISNVKDFVPILPVVADHWNNIDHVKSCVPGRFLWYVCCGPDRPNTFIRSPLLEARFIPLLTAYMGFDGFLRWNYTVWPENPLTRISYRAPVWKAGDTNFVYPGRSGKPVLTLRYKNLLRGIQDHETLQMAKEKMSGQGKERVNEMLGNYFNFIIREKNLTFYNSEKRASNSLYSLDYSDYTKGQAYLFEILEE
jgi:hypothetical protein